MQAMSSFPIVKSSHSKISSLDFSWHTRVSLVGPWGHRRAWKWPKYASNPQIFLGPTLMRATPSFPIVKSSHSRIFYDFSWHIGLVIGNLWGPSVAHGGPSEPENGQNMTSQRVLSTFPASNAQFSHSEILYLNFSWHTRLSIGNHFGPSGVLGSHLSL